MSLTIYPAMGYDSFISLTDADSIISEFSVHYSSWSALTSSEQEVYLRIATDRIMNAVSFDTTNANGYLDSLIHFYRMNQYLLFHYIHMRIPSMYYFLFYL